VRRPEPAPRRPAARLREWHLPAGSAVVLIVALAVLRLGGRPAAGALVPAALGLALLLGNVAALAVLERRTWARPARRLVAAVNALAAGEVPGGLHDPGGAPEFDALARAIEGLRARSAEGDGPGRMPDESWLGGEGSPPTPWPAPGDGGGRFEPARALTVAELDPSISGDFSTLDMVSRLDPRGLRWLESSPAERDFLGWSLADLRRMSFPEIVHPDDRELARDQLMAALAKGEAHGLIYRIRTARGEFKAIEMNIGVRYGPDLQPTHLRCHVTDVTAKVKASRELRRRTRELIRANEQLRRINRELQELKDRYGDLYQNAPAMYFTLDERGRFLECNDTLLRSLGHPREALIGRPYTAILAPARHADFAANYAEFLRVGFVELENQWRKADASPIDVWVTATVIPGPEGTPRQSRGVAQDVTARRVLEAELREKNDRLARANVELSRKNKELDEFTYVVSHDLQEPLRTLIAFSDFLLRDCGDRLDDDGKEYVRYLVDASRRMRALIRDLLDLSRAGKVTAEFAPVDLDEVVELIKADYAELIRAKAGEVRIAGAPLPTVWGDRDRIGQLLGNLVGNGLKYHRGGGGGPVVEVGVAAGGPPGWATLSIKDNGIGIDPQFHAKVFHIFRRLHTREEYEGTGAGLAICQKIAQAHGGRIWVESQVGRGSTFFLTLPLLPTGAIGPTRALNGPRTELLHGP